MTTIDRPVQLSDAPRQPPPRRPWRWWQIGLLVLVGLIVAGTAAAAGLLYHYSQDLPELNQLQNYQPSLVTQVYSSDRQLIGRIEGRATGTQIADLLGLLDGGAPDGDE